MNRSEQISQKGSAIFIILIAIALFAALSFAVGDMMRSGNADMAGEQKAVVLASEMVDFGSNLKNAVQSIRISNGCEEDEISFTRVASDAYEHSPVQPNGCKIFHGSGGGVSYLAPPDDVTSNDWVFTGANIVDDVGTAAPDLVAVLRDIPQGLCNAINNRLGLSTTLTADTTIDFTVFTGSYASTQTMDQAGGDPAGCLLFDNGGTDEYLFYQVLIGR